MPSIKKINVNNTYYDIKDANAVPLSSEDKITISADGGIDINTSNSTTVNINGQEIATKKDIENLPEPMIFKGSVGTGGTITTLPSASTSNEGFTYKVITDGTYQGISAKVGDTFIKQAKNTRDFSHEMNWRE